MDTLLLADGHNLLFRMFYGMPDHFRTREGVRYNAVYGFLNAMAAVTDTLDPSHVLVLFDTEECGERRSLDADYKANRPDWSEVPPDELPFAQLPAICLALEECGIPHAFARGCEADDLIASYAMAAGEGCRVMILSTDRDYWQLIGERISVVRYQNGICETATPDTVMAKFGVRPDQFADWKCLVGDSSDNIAGAPGVGPKTASALLAEFGTLDALLDRAEEIPRAKIRDSVRSSRERLLLNRRLIRLEGTAPLPRPREDLLCRPVFPRNLLALARESASRAAKTEADQ